MLCMEGRVALVAFFVFAFMTTYYFYVLTQSISAQLDWAYLTLGYFAASLLTCFVPFADVARNAAFLGAICGTGFTLGTSLHTWNIFGWYMVVLAFFHLSEYILTALYNYEHLSVDSFIINHSLEYHIAIIASVLEFAIEVWMCPTLKTSMISRCVSVVGLLMVVFGESCRKLAMITAKSNFTHIVQYQKVKDHQLVKHGVYSISRHPSYFGWFYWSVGTQLLLCNPFCAPAYAYASWMFFEERVKSEECALVRFFGEEYIEYVQSVPTRIPFVHGIEEEVKSIEIQRK